MAFGKHKLTLHTTKKPLVCNVIRRRTIAELFAEDPRSDAVSSWRVFKILSEFVAGFDFLRQHRFTATFFGSVRAKPDDPMYQNASKLASRLSQAGFTITTGGAAGIMSAANKGAYEAGGHSVGLNIELPKAQAANGYLTHSINFDHFFVRKVMLAFAAEVYIFFPGGFGTLDELFEIVTLIQTGKVNSVPVILYGREFWKPMTSWIENELRAQDKIDPDDVNIYRVVDSVDEAYDYIMQCADRGSIADRKEELGIEAQT